MEKFDAGGYYIIWNSVKESRGKPKTGTLQQAVLGRKLLEVL